MQCQLLISDKIAWPSSISKEMKPQIKYQQLQQKAKEKKLRKSANIGINIYNR